MALTTVKQPTVLIQQKNVADGLAPLLMGIGIFAAFLWLSFSGTAPWSDAGGYENMLRYFLGTGHVDYMHWSQPTFIGLLPLAAPWSHLFGATDASLQWLGVSYGLFLISGLYLFMRRHTRPAYAALLSACVVLFTEFFSLVPTFMTDIPYAAYLVWFLVVHQKLEDRYAQQAPPRMAFLWTAWGLLFLLASLTRSFTLVLVPVFLALMLRGRSRPSTFARSCFLASAVAGLLCLGIIRLLGRNGFSLADLTVVPELLTQHHWARLDMRAFCVSLIQTALMLVPALALVPSLLRPKPRPVEIGIGGAALLLAFHFWRKGLLPTLFLLPSVPASAHALALLGVVLAPVALVLLFRLWGRAMAASPTNTVWVLLALVAAHFLVLPIMQHPLLRHVFPAFLALLMLAVTLKVKPQPRILVGVTTTLIIVGICHLLTACQDRLANATQYNLAWDLMRSGVPLPEIDGGWSWFCAQDLHPGTAQNESYVTRYQSLANDARYSVTEEATKEPTARVVYRTSLKTFDSEVTVTVFDRTPQSIDGGGVTPLEFRP